MAISGATAVERANEEQMVRDHLPLVHYAVAEVATKLPRHVSRDDLVSAAMIGLAQAARNYDPTRGVAFDRYASTRIRGSLIDELRTRDWASRSVRAKARRMAVVAEDLTAKLGRTPTTAEVAVEMRCDAGDVTALHEDVHRAVVLNYDSLTATGESESVLPSDPRSPDVVLLDRERQSYLVDAVGALPERLQRVVIGYFFEEHSMQAIADELGVSESRISQMRSEALALLKEGINSQLDPEEVPAPSPSPRVARRKAAYYAAIAASSDYRSRLDAAPRPARVPRSA